MQSFVQTISDNWEFIVGASGVTIISIVGIALTLLTLPGMWIAIAAAIGVQLWQPTMFSWWTLGICIGLALLAEMLEFFASAAGAAKGGASKKGALGAIIGSLVGAIVGSFFFPPIGTVLGAVAGAGGAVIWVEMSLEKRGFRDATKAGTGAAVGRLLATFIKVTFAAVVALTLSIAAWTP